MLSIEQVKTLMNDPGMSDKEAEEIRRACHALAEIALEIWMENNHDSPRQLQVN